METIAETYKNQCEIYDVKSISWDLEITAKSYCEDNEVFEITLLESESFCYWDCEFDADFNRFQGNEHYTEDSYESVWSFDLCREINRCD